MWRQLPSALRFARSWTRPPAGLVESEVRIPILHSNRSVAGLLVEPERPAPLPGWVILHGMTRRGPRHPELLRFVRAIASTGARVLVPEIEEWVALDFAPEKAASISNSAVHWLHDSPGTTEGGVHLMGFSFGAPHAVRLALSGEASGKLRAVVGWGGYAQIEHVLWFAFTGEHEFNGRQFREEPDPYARWVIGINCLGLASEFRDRARLIEALRCLATEAGDQQIGASHPHCVAVRNTLSSSLPARDREIFDLFAPPPGARPDPVAARRLMDALVPAVRKSSPLLDPFASMRSESSSGQGKTRTTIPVRIFHGRSDRMLPFTESLRLHETLAGASPDLTVRILGQFGHSARGPRSGTLGGVRERLDFLGAIQSILSPGNAARR